MKWIAAPAPESNLVEHLQNTLGVPPTIAYLLAQRGIKNFDQAKEFFRPERSKIHDPFLMKDMDVAVDRLLKAKEHEETIMVYGDYDVDGTSAVALVFSYLQQLGLKVHYYIPDRYTEGYGVSLQGIATAQSLGCTLIVTLDCGIKAFEPINKANSLGIDVIVCDHHLPGEKLPKAVAVLDPKRADCPYPYKELCGCGIGFKLIHGLTLASKGTLEDIVSYLDLTAIAIAADIVPITGENRLLAAFGLQQLQQQPRLGIAPFLKQVKGEITISDLVFKIAPRINAAGRINHGKEAVALFLVTDTSKAMAQGNTIETYNTSRRSIEEQTTREALAHIEDENNQEGFTTVVWHQDWHKGVLGIVASRLIETYHRPTVVLAKNGAHFTGSVRSIRGFDVHRALTDCAHLLIQYGGHQYAAGLTIEEKQLQSFKVAFENRVKQELNPEDLVPYKKYDVLIALNEIQPKFFRILNQMRPFGPQNMRPVFRTNGCWATSNTKQVGATKDHLKLELEDASGAQCKGIAFGFGNHYEVLAKGARFDILYTLDENHYQGHISLQLLIKALQINP